jgi:predicted ArsR family transcriptional regulator
MTPEPPRSGLSALPELDAALLLLISDYPDSTVEFLAREAVASVGSVRQHLLKLGYEGLVERRTETAGGPGRPTHLYRVTPAARDLFPRSHGFSLLAVLGILQRDHPEVYDDVFSKVHVQFSEPQVDAARIARTPADRRAAEIAPWIARYGHRAAVEIGQEGGAITISYCPLLDVAHAHPGFCAAECSWLERYFPEFDVTLEQTKASGFERCIFRFTLSAD